MKTKNETGEEKIMMNYKTEFDIWKNRENTANYLFMQEKITTDNNIKFNFYKLINVT